ncbi:MAG: RluA family pseudouridine synthase [Pseudomonadales bacterium]|nr:RluA family pseudouridine synthase [Pseudomonadales bacterium]
MTEKYTHHVPPPCEEDIQLLFVDDDIVVVNKPAGLLSVPGRFVKDCVLKRLLDIYPDVVVVHRLDLDTSGLMVYARTKHAVSNLNKQFRERLVKKIYIADVYGAMIENQGVIALPIAPDPINRPKQRIDFDLGKKALTKFKCIRRTAKGTRVELIPVTGRSHQLRIHLASIHHPILGCDLYAHDEALKASERLLLHALSLEFDHPTRGEKLSFTTELPF